MQTRKVLYWGAQIFGWSIYGILVLLATYADDPTRLSVSLIASLMVFIFAGISVTHLMRLFFLKKDWLSLKLAPLIPRILLVSVIGSTAMVLINLIASFVLRGDSDRPITILVFLIEIMALSFLMVMWNAIYFTYHFFQKSIKQEMNNLQLEASQREIELKNLISQLNPHFLFNSLNSIRALIDLDPAKSKVSITTLSNLLRSSLLLGKKPFISLSEELQIVKSYLDLEKIRFEERLEVEWQIDENVNELQVPPFILQTQVENAIKHGISRIIEGGKIIIRTEELNSNKVLISIENTGRIEENADAGIGIENTKRRLYLQYQGKAQFSLIEENGLVVCQLLIEK